MDTLPIISLEKLKDLSSPSGNEEHKRLYDTCLEHGFFYLKDHGISLELVQKTIMLNFLGVLCYIQAVSKGSVGLVATLSALYPLVVIILAVVVLQETVTVKQAIGMGLALAAIACFAT